MDSIVELKQPASLILGKPELGRILFLRVENVTEGDSPIYIYITSI